MFSTVEQAYWVTLLLSVPAALFTIRLFIIQHDCGHRSFFSSKRLNDIIGAISSVVTLTPHEYWRRAHNLHHATCGNLEKRGIGDITLLTVAEYRALPAFRRLAYRIYRMPAVLLIIGPFYLFFIKNRLPLDLILRQPRLLLSVMVTNAGIAGALIAMGYGFGFLNLLMIHLPVTLLAAIIGVWLFYVQHQFERTYWQKEAGWNFQMAAVLASSHYKLPQPLRWFSGDIGIHHIHHLCGSIPNYRLKACLADIPALQTINTLGFIESLKCFRLALWDEGKQRLVSFKSLRQA